MRNQVLLGMYSAQLELAGRSSGKGIILCTNGKQLKQRWHTALRTAQKQHIEDQQQLKSVEY